MTTRNFPPMIEDGLQRPKVSVVMPTYNRATLLRESAMMILNQTFREIELIIIDDYSTDSTPQVVTELVGVDSRVRYYRAVKNGGVASALNQGLMLARGEYIQIAHDHDVYQSTLIEEMVSRLDKSPLVVFVHTGCQGCDYLGNPNPQAMLVRDFPEVTNGRVWRRYMLSRLDSPVTALCMIRRQALEKIGLFDPEFGIPTDVDMWLRLCSVGDIGYIDKVLILLRGREPGHPNAGTNWLAMDQLFRIHRKHLSLCYRGWEYFYRRFIREASIDIFLLAHFLNSLRHRRLQVAQEGRRYLRQHGPLLSRLVAWVL